jgi:hypothetical protein
VLEFSAGFRAGDTSPTEADQWDREDWGSMTMCEPSQEEIDAWREAKDEPPKSDDKDKSEEELQRQYDNDHPGAARPLGLSPTNISGMG